MSVVHHLHSPSYAFWKCDGCGDERVAEPNKTRVRGWARVMNGRYPQYSNEKMLHFCPKCWEVF